DRSFLDRTVTRIVEIDGGSRRAVEFAGGWSEYEAARLAARRRHYDAYAAYAGERERIEEQMRRMQQWEERGYGQGRRKKKTKDVRKAYTGRIERLERVEKPFQPWELHFELGSDRRSGDVVARLEGAVVERGSFRLGPVDLAVGWRDRIAIVGPNGSGKTTLLRAVLGELPLAAGRRYLGTGGVAGGLRRHGAPRDPRPPFPGGVRGYPDAGAVTNPGAGRSSRPSATRRSTRSASKSQRQLNHLRATSASGATTAARAAATTS